MRTTTLAIGLGVALLAGSGCVNREGQQQAKRTEEIIKDPTRPVTVEPVRVTTLTETLQITGNLTTAEDVQVGVKQPGRLVAVYVKDGDPVRAGQILATQDSMDAAARVQQAQAQVSAARSALAQASSNAAIQPSRTAAAVRAAEAQVRQARSQLAKLRAGARPEERAQAEAALASAKANMETARAERDRALKLFKEGASSEKRYEQAEAAFRAAEAQYESARQQVLITRDFARSEDLASAQEQVRQAEENVRSAKAQQKLDVVLDQQVEAARANLNSALAQLQISRQALTDLQITAPFSGTISGRPTQVGSYLAPGQAVARIIGGAGVYFEGEVPESQISAVQPGKQVAVKVDALGEQTFYGRVAAVDPLGDKVGRLFNVRVQLAGGAAAMAKPGMFATGVVTLRAVPGATVVPSSAIVESAGSTFVWVLDGDKVKKANVIVGLRQDGQTQVKGISEGVRVVTSGQGQLVEGTVVKPDNGKAGTANSRNSSRGTTL